MAGFDIIDAAGKGYATAWRERFYLARLILPVVFIKTACLGATGLLGLEQDFIRQSFIMLPAFFIEGWLAVHLVRLIVLGERGNAAPVPSAKAGMVVFVLIRFLLTGLAALVFASSPEELSTEAANQERGSLSLFAALGVLAFAIWSFRYLWLYIPVAVGVPIRAFLREIGGFSTSLSMIGVWLIGFVPFILALGAGTGLILSLFGAEGADVPLPATALVLALQAIFDTATTLVTTAAMTYAVREIAQRKG